MTLATLKQQMVLYISLKMTLATLKQLIMQINLLLTLLQSLK